MRSAPLWGRAQAQAGRLRTGSASAGSASPVGSIRKRSPDMDADGIDAFFFYPSLGPVLGRPFMIRGSPPLSLAPPRRRMNNDLSPARVAPVATRAIGISSLSGHRRKQPFDAEMAESGCSRTGAAAKVGRR